MSTNEHNIHIFHLFCTLINSKYLDYVALKISKSGISKTLIKRDRELYGHTLYLSVKFSTAKAILFEWIIVTVFNLLILV